MSLQIFSECQFGSLTFPGCNARVMSAQGRTANSTLKLLRSAHGLGSDMPILYCGARAAHSERRRQREGPAGHGHFTPPNGLDGGNHPPVALKRRVGEGDDARIGCCARRGVAQRVGERVLVGLRG